MTLYALFYHSPATIARNSSRVLVGIFSTLELAEKHSAYYAFAERNPRPTFNIQPIALDTVAAA